LVVWNRCDENSAAIARKETLIYARTLSAPERVQWMMSQGRYSDALAVAQAAPRGALRAADLSLETVGESYLKHLHQIGDHSSLAEIMKTVIDNTTPPFHALSSKSEAERGENKRKRWKQWVEVFRKSKKVHLIAEKIPLSNPKFETEFYGEVLIDLVRSSPEVMGKILKVWPSDIYSVSTVTRETEKAMAEAADGAKSQGMQENLLFLYALGGRRDETLNFLLKERSPKVFDYVEDNQLYEAVRSESSIRQLYETDQSRASTLLSRAELSQLPPEAVVPIFEQIGERRWLHSYLHTMFRKDRNAIVPYHKILLPLYCEFGPSSGLISFLKTSVSYSLDQALAELEKAKDSGKGSFAKERVFVLSRIGDWNAALKVLLHEMHDIPGAIDFAKKNNDPELWDRLIEFSKSDVETLTALLECGTGFVDPISLVEIITPEMEIPDLRDHIHRILVDAALERSLREGTARALDQDARSMVLELEAEMRGPLRQKPSI